MTLSFKILGPLAVLDDGGRRLQLGGRLQRVLLASLLIRANDVVSVDRLIDNLWGAHPPVSARASLHNVVARLRRILGPETICARPPGYAIAATASQLDSVRFTLLVERARGRPPAERVDMLETALALWHGDPLADVFYEEFAQPAIAHLDELRACAIEDLLEAKLDSVAADGARALLPELQSLVAAYPYREQMLRQLVRALCLSGNRVDAHRACIAWRSRLAAEWGVDELTNIEQRAHESPVSAA